jgi:hypothetical protein
MRFIILEQTVYGTIGKLFKKNKPYEVNQTARNDDYITNDNDLSMLLEVLPVKYWWQDEGKTNSFAAHVKELEESVSMKHYVILHDDIENSETVLFDAELPYEVIDGKLTHDVTHREIELKHIPVEWHFVTMEDLPEIIFKMKIALYNMSK